MSGDDLRPWRGHERSATLDDAAVVNYVAKHGPTTPRAIARGRFRENVIRIQCRYLDRHGILDEVAGDVFVADDDAPAVFDRCCDTRDGYLEDDALVASDRDSLDISDVDVEILRELNSGFFEDGEFRYGTVRGDAELTRRRIENVKRYRIDRVVREFPRFEPLVPQCAHWVRAIVGLHFFPDANHRTAVSTLAAVLREQDYLSPESTWPFEWIDIAVTRSKLLRGYHCDVRFDTLWERDELYYHWERYFKYNLFDTDKPSRNSTPPEFLDHVLEYSRDVRENWRG